MTRIRWLPVPSELVTTQNCEGAEIFDSHYPSALLVIQIPDSNSNTKGTISTCSIDARWAEGISESKEFDESFPNPPIQGRARINTFSTDYDWMPINDGTWQSVKLDITWLSMLFPTVNDTSELLLNGDSIPASQKYIERTTLAIILDQARKAGGLSYKNLPNHYYKSIKQAEQGQEP